MQSLAGTNGTHKPDFVTVRSDSLPVLPEAPCSVNGFFHVAGYERDFQATGRGRTPQEAVEHLQGTITMTQQALGVPRPALPATQPLTRLEVLALCLAKGLARAQAEANVPLADRLLKGMQIALADDFERNEAGQIIGVYSQRDGISVYVLESQGRCRCPSAEKLAKGDCKHRLAYCLAQKAEALTHET